MALTPIPCPTTGVVATSVLVMSNEPYVLRAQSRALRDRGRMFSSPLAASGGLYLVKNTKEIDSDNPWS